MLSSVPEGVPELVTPTPMKDDELREIPKLFAMPGFPEIAKNTWREFCNNPTGPVVIYSVSLSSLCIMNRSGCFSKVFSFF